MLVFMGLNYGLFDGLNINHGLVGNINRFHEALDSQKVCNVVRESDDSAVSLVTQFIAMKRQNNKSTTPFFVFQIRKQENVVFSEEDRLEMESAANDNKIVSLETVIKLIKMDQDSQFRLRIKRAIEAAGFVYSFPKDESSDCAIILASRKK